MTSLMICVNTLILAVIGIASYGALGHVPPRLPAIYFYVSLCSYKSMKAISHVKRIDGFAYHSY